MVQKRRYRWNDNRDKDAWSYLYSRKWRLAANDRKVWKKKLKSSGLDLICSAIEVEK